MVLPRTPLVDVALTPSLLPLVLLPWGDHHLLASYNMHANANYCDAK